MHDISHAQDGSNAYVLSTSEQARQNLDYQHQLMAEESYKQLQKAGLKKGQIVWDIGGKKHCCLFQKIINRFICLQRSIIFLHGNSVVLSTTSSCNWQK